MSVLPIFESIVSDGFATGLMFSDSIVSDESVPVSLVKSVSGSVRCGSDVSDVAGSSWVWENAMVSLERNSLSALGLVFRLLSSR